MALLDIHYTRGRVQLNSDDVSDVPNCTPRELGRLLQTLIFNSQVS